MNASFLKRSILAFCTILTILVCYFGYTHPFKPRHKLNPVLSSQFADVIAWLTDNTSWYQRGTNQGWAGFDKVYFISLPSRLANVQQVAERLQIGKSAWILNAVHKDSLDPDKLLALNMVTKEYLHALTPTKYGAIGCQLSHLAVMLDCYKDPLAQTCVIFEDDLYRPAKEVTKQVIDFKERAERLGIDWDMLYLDYCYEVPWGKTEQDIRWLMGSSCTHALVIKKSTIQTIFAASLPMRRSYDATLGYLMLNKTILSIGPNKARYFAQNRKLLGSTIVPDFSDYPSLNLRFM